MKLCIDTEECAKEGISIDIILLVMSFYFDTPVDSISAAKANTLGLIEYGGYRSDNTLITPSVTQKGADLIESIILNSEFQAPKGEKDKYVVIADKLRELYPKGRKPGTSYMWRDSTSIIAKKLKALVKKYRCSFTEEEAIEATKKYIKSFNGDYKYMQLLKYFILKKDLDKEEETSQFLSFLENKDDDEINNQWMVEVR